MKHQMNWMAAFVLIGFLLGVLAVLIGSMVLVMSFLGTGPWAAAVFLGGWMVVLFFGAAWALAR